MPLLAAWTDPARSAPLGDVHVDVHLQNTWRGQLGPDGRLALPGLLFVGDSVCTTDPSAGRGFSTCWRQVRRLLQLLESRGDDVEAVGLELEDWNTEQVKPWYTEHLRTAAERRSQWAGRPLGLTGPRSGEAVLATADHHPSMMAAVPGILSMRALPETLDPWQEAARRVYADGWDVPVPAGPSLDDLADLVAASLAEAPR